jgi:hypothetical protein
MLQVHCSRSYSGDYDEGCRFTVAGVILETMMKVAGSL